MAAVFKRSLFFRKLIFILTLGFVTVFSTAFAADNLRPRSASQGRAKLIINELKKTQKDGGNVVKEDLTQRLVVKFSEVRKEDVAIAGGKGANLGELQHVNGIFVPPGIAVTTEAFKRHINKGSVVTVKDGVQTTVTLRNYIDQRLAGLNYNDSLALAEAGRDIRAAIEAGTMPEDVEKEVTAGYQGLCALMGIKDIAVAVRSSATAEDMADASFAGQLDTYLNMRGNKEVLGAVKRNWASLFTDRAIFYRHDKNIDHGQASLSAVIQVMINSKKAGTAFSVHIDTGFGGADPKDLVVSVDGAWGIGEGVVSGAASPDSFVVKKDKSGRFRIYRKVFGAKLNKVVFRKESNINAKEGTELVETSYTERHTFALSDSQVIEVAKGVENIHKHYGNRFMDVEWAFDENDKFWILQARSETIWNQWNEKNPNTVKMENIIVPDSVADAADATKLLVSGIAQFKSAVGKVVMIDSRKEGTELAKELDRIKQGDVLVTTMTKPDMVPGMKRAGAIVTDEGGPTCHAAIIARELEIPCIVGTSKATKLLKEGMLITVDANRGKVYEGALALEEVKKNTEPLKLPITKTKIGTIVASPFLAMKTSALSLFPSDYGVGLLRKEFVDTTEILVHPLAGLAYDMYNDPNFIDAEAKAEIKKNIIDNEELRITIEETIKGYVNFKEFYKDKLANTLAVIAATQMGGQHVIMRTTDFKTNEYENQIGGTLYEPKEKNPMMGYRGINRMLSQAYKAAFELEIEAIKQAREMQDNIDVMFPVVRTPVELKKAVDLFAQHGLVRGDRGFQIGMMVEVPANIFQAEEFYKYVDFMSIGSNDLTQFTLALGRDNDKMKKFFDEANPAVKKALEIVIKTTKKVAVVIRSGFCGQRPSNDPKFSAFLVQVGIDSISVVPQSFEDVVKVVAAQEKELAGKEFDPNIAGWSIPEKAGNPQLVTAAEVDASEIIKSIDIHPQALLKYDKGHIAGPGIYEELKGKTAREYVAGKVYDAIMEKTRATDGTIVYSTDDLDKVVYESLKYGKGEELFDENPQLGFCGLARVVDAEWQEFFAWQLEGIKKAIQDSGRKNISVKLDLPRILPEVSTALEMIRKAGLVPGQDGFQVGMEIATPSSVLLLDEFIKTGLNFVTENNDRFLSYTMAIDPGNLHLSISKAEKDAALVNPQKVWTTIAEKNNIPMVITSSELVKQLKAVDEKVFAGMSVGFDNFVNSLQGLENSSGGLVIGANTVFENAGTLPALQKIKSAQSGLKIVFWAKDKAAADKLKAIGAGDITDIVIADSLAQALKALKEFQVANNRIVLINSDLDSRNIENEFQVKNIEEFLAKPEVKGVRVVAVKYGSSFAGGENINAMPLVLARAIAAVYKGEEKVVVEYEKLSQNSGLSEDTLKALSQLDQEFSTVPLVKVSEDIAKAQMTYEETISKI